MLQTLIYHLVLALLAVNRYQQYRLCRQQFYHWLSASDHLPAHLLHDVTQNAANSIDDCRQQATTQHRKQLRAVVKSLKPCGC